MAKESTHKDVAVNRKAFHDFFIEEKMEAGLVLKGTEVKSLREGKANLRESYARAEQGKSCLASVPYRGL